MIILAFNRSPGFNQDPGQQICDIVWKIISHDNQKIRGIQSWELGVETVPIASRELLSL
jgi:hypothetical protein